MTETAAPRAYRFRDFCQRCGVGRSKGYELIRSQQIRAKKVGRNIVVTEQAIQDWLAGLPDAA